jgi:hypothetical protein
VGTGFAFDKEIAAHSSHPPMIPNRSDKLVAFASAIRHAVEDVRGSTDPANAAMSELDGRLAGFQHAIDTTEAAARTKILASSRLAMSDKALKTWLTKARLVVMLSRGLKWSESWIPTGFTDRRSRIPTGIDARVMLARALVAFFARQPECGVPFAEVTAARGRAVYERVIQSAAMLRLAKDDCRIAERRKCVSESDLHETLRRIVSRLKSELGGKYPVPEELSASAPSQIAFVPPARSQVNRAAAA